MSKGSTLVSSAILGAQIEACIVNGKTYVIKPPTIAQLAGVGMALGEVGDGKDMAAVLQTVTNGAEGCARALSYLIKGDESLTKELSKGRIEEVIEGIEKGLSFISIENFQRLLALTRNVAMLIARPK